MATMLTVAKAPRTLTFDQVAALAESVGLPGVTFAQIAKGESGFQPGAVGHDPGGTQGYGLWQITTKYNDDIIKRFGGRERLLHDPYANALAAKAIFDRQGLGAWYGTKYLTARNAHYKGAPSDLANGSVPQPASAPGASPMGGLMAGGDPGQSADATALLGMLSQRQRSTPASAPLPAPAATAGPALPQAYRALSAGQGPAPKQDIGSLLAMVQTPGQGGSPGMSLGGAVSGVSAPPAASAASGGGSSPKAPKGLPTGVAKFEGKEVAAWIAPALEYARQHGWKGTVNSGFRSYADQQRIWNSGVRPAARPGTSNHEGSDFPRGAVDVSDAQQLSQILAHSPYRKRLIWAGSKDPVHFSHPHNGGY